MGNNVRSQEEVQSCYSIDQCQKKCQEDCALTFLEFLNHIEVEESVTH